MKTLSPVVYIVQSFTNQLVLAQNMKHQAAQIIYPGTLKCFCVEPGTLAQLMLVEQHQLLEELRVSLFAQALKTPVPVSVKRLTKLWQSIRHAQT